MSFMLGVLAVLLSFPIAFVISVVISFFTKSGESFWDRVWITVVFIYFLLFNPYTILITILVGFLAIDFLDRTFFH
ncbi:hypothetical protein HpBT320_02630 [Helicobacter pylori]